MSSTVFQMTEQDLLAAWRLQRRHIVAVTIMNFAPLAGLCLYVALSWRNFADYGWYAITFNPSLPLAALFLALVNLWLVKIKLPGNAKRVLKQQKGLAGEITATWDAEGMTMAGSSGHSRLAWGDYIRWLEDDANFVLFHSDNVINPLPKRVLSGEQIAEIRGSLTAALGKAGKKRKLN